MDRISSFRKRRAKKKISDRVKGFVDRYLQNPSNIFMDSKERRKREKAEITDGADEVVVNGKLFFKHPVHYANYEFTISERDKFWGLRVMLALNQAIWATLNHQRPALSQSTVTNDGEGWRKAIYVFEAQLTAIPPSPKPMLFSLMQGFAGALHHGNQANRLRMAADLAWNIGVNALKASPPSDWSLFQASASRLVHAWLTALATTTR